MKDKSGHCVKCGTWRQSLHDDHIIPKWKGGRDEPENKQQLCANCHEDKTREDLKGRIISEEQRQNHSQKMKGRKASLETRAKLSLAHKGKKYKPWSQEAKDRMSVLQRTAWTPERRARQSIATLEGLQKLRKE